MALKKGTKRLLALYAIGILVFFAGLAGGFIANKWSALSILLLVGGSVLIGLAFLIFKKQASLSKGLIYWKRAGMTFLIVFLFGFMLLQLNSLAIIYNLRLDFTKLKQHTLTKNTTKYIKALKKDVKITAFYVGIAPKYLEDLLNEFERVGDGRIETEIIDPVEQIGYAAQFGNVISGKENKVIVQSGNERRDIDFTKTPLTEEPLTNAIVRVTRAERYLYFLTGHGEFNIHEDEQRGYSIFEKLLASNNFISQTLMLDIVGKIPEDCDVLVVAGPQKELTSKEQRLIKEYLDQGGDALFLVENVVVTTPDNPLTEEQIKKNPSLNDILNDWGVHVRSDIVVDLGSHASGDVGSPATKNYMPHKALVKDLEYTFYIRPRSIEILNNRRETIKAVPFVLTMSGDSSWGETNRTLDVKYEAGDDTAGPVPISAVLWEPNEEFSDTRILVFTDGDFISNAYISSYSNAQMGLNLVNWLAETDYEVFMDQKEIKVEQLDLTAQQKRVVAIILILIPLLIGIVGGMVWMVRRI